MNDYWQRVADTMNFFAEPDDNLECIQIHQSDIAGTCQMCGHSPIFWMHTLYNDRTGQSLIVGRECIHNYKQIYVNKSESPPTVIFPRYYHRAASMFNETVPNNVTVGDLSEGAQRRSQYPLSPSTKQYADDEHERYVTESWKASEQFITVPFDEEHVYGDRIPDSERAQYDYEGRADDDWEVHAESAPEYREYDEPDWESLADDFN